MTSSLPCICGRRASRALFSPNAEEEETGLESCGNYERAPAARSVISAMLRVRSHGQYVWVGAGLAFFDGWRRRRLQRIRSAGCTQPSTPVVSREDMQAGGNAIAADDGGAGLAEMAAAGRFRAPLCNCGLGACVLQCTAGSLELAFGKSRREGVACIG